MTTIHALRSAVAGRHSPAGRAFWAAALAALAAGGVAPERAAFVLADAAAEGWVAASIEAWLAPLARRCEVDAARVLAHVDRVEAALAGLAGPVEPRPPSRQRILAALRARELESVTA
ncbi:MAG: hypothetical protein ABMA64_17410 [Myxococcota bacterium]